MIEKVRDFLKVYFNDIMLFIIVVLLIMLLFAIGYIAVKYQTKSSLELKNFNHTEIQ